MNFLHNITALQHLHNEYAKTLKNKKGRPFKKYKIEVNGRKLLLTKNEIKKIKEIPL